MKKIMLSEINEPVVICGNHVLCFHDDFSDTDLSSIGGDTAIIYSKDYGLKSVKWYGECKDGVVSAICSSRDFPIIARWCRYDDADGTVRGFYKIYRPKETLAFRHRFFGVFQYGYINGLWELREKFKAGGGKKLDNVYWFPNFKAAMTLAEKAAITPLWANYEEQSIPLRQLKEISCYATAIYCPYSLEVFSDGEGLRIKN